MALRYNHASCGGRLAAPPRFAYTGGANKSPVCNFTVCIPPYKDGKDPTFIDCVVWGSQAETLNARRQKGDWVFVDGEFKQERWDDKRTGDKRSKIVIDARIVWWDWGAGDKPNPEQEQHEFGSSMSQPEYDREVPF